MASVAPSAPPEPVKRPRHLLLALAIAWFFGFGGMTEGCSTLSFYRSGVEASAIVPHFADDATRTHVLELAERTFVARDQARNRLQPLGAASLVLGLAMLFSSWNSMRASAFGRSMLIQATIAQAALMVAHYFAVPEVRATTSDFDRAVTKAALEESTPDPNARDQWTRIYDRFLPKVPGIWLGMRTMLSALIVVSLTRSSTRKFFAAAEQSFEIAP
jgi:hypothetical protein